MENKNDKNYPFYIKYLNIICYGVSIIFFLFVLLAGISDYSNEKAFDNKINSMLEYCNSLNSSIENNKNQNEESDNIENDNSEQIYFDGKTALIDSYNKSLINSNSFEVESTGKIKLSAILGVYADIQMDILIERFNKEKVYEEIKANIIESNLPEAIIGQARSGVKRIKIGNSAPQLIITNNIKFEGTKIVADFTGAGVTVKEDEMFFNYNPYIIDEKTIKEVTYFKIKKVNNVIKNYYVQVKLDPIASTQDYGKVIAQQVGCSLPNFKSILLTAIIDAQGNLVSFSSTDIFSLVLSGFNANAQSTMTYKVSGINQENTFEYTGF